MTTRQRAFYAVDNGCFMLFHPKDYQSGAGDGLLPPDFALEQGLVIGLYLGADGFRGLELLDGPLLDEDRRQVEPEPFVFPLEVKRSKLYATDRISSIADFDWKAEPHLKLSKGKYRAELYVVDQTQNDGRFRRDVNWLLALEPVTSFEGIDAWSDLPREDGPRRPSPLAKARKPERRVRHPKFGIGTVVGEEIGTPAKLVVKFELGERKIVETFLTPVSAED